MRRQALILLLPATLMLGGCLAKAVVDVATAPVKVVSKGVDLATTSQSEADEKRGREIRRREERLAKLERDYEKQLDDCEDGDRRACDDARDTYAEMQQIIPSIPYEPEDDWSGGVAARCKRSLIAMPMPSAGIGATAIRGLGDRAPR